MAEQEKNCYLGINGKKHGPMSEQDIRALYDKNKITSDAQFIRVGMKEWVALSKSGVITPDTDEDGLPPLPKDDGLPPLPMLEDERVLKNIDKFGSNKECKCLLCGYSGLMGVVRNKTNPGLAVILALGFAATAFAVFMGLFFGIMGAIGMHLDSRLTSVFSILIAISVVGWSMQVMISMGSKKVLFCPNCEKEITEK